MIITIKQKLFLISLLLLFIELFFYLKIKYSIKTVNTENQVLLQLKTFFIHLSVFHEFIYMFIYFLLLMISFYYLPIIIGVICIQSVSLLTDIYVYRLLVKSDK